jgi:glycosyltransferase involved in cell wall biosynthesis
MNSGFVPPGGSMRLAFIPPGGAWASLDHVRQVTAAVLAQHNELTTYPPEYQFASKARRREILKEWLSSCDAVVGCLDLDVLQVRHELDRCVPWAVFVLGRMPRGAPTMPVRYPLLHTRDTMVCTCTADAVLSTKFFPNAAVRIVPFAFDDTQYYRADAVTCAAMRAGLGIGPDEKLLLYAGRLALEKNIHTVLKTFRVVLNAVPEARLVIAGEEMNSPFREFGAQPLGVKRSLRRLCTHLGLDGDRVLFVGQRAPEDLRALYGAADVLVNLTLNHDENFGYAQVEAMACGLPAVGSTWGGLKDTIADGVTGVQVPTIVTAAGVKVDWWSAANSIVQLLRSPESMQAMSQRCCEIARERYSITEYGHGLEQVVRDCVAAKNLPREPLQASAFAAEYWATCKKDVDERPPYRRGEESLRLYRELITPYASAPTNGAANRGEDVWVLATALRVEADGRIAVNDPICPFELTVPPNLVASVRALADQFGERPVLAVASLQAAGPALREALVWMHEAGLVLRTRRGIIDLECAPASLGQPMFEMREIDHRTDIVWFS